MTLLIHSDVNIIESSLGLHIEHGCLIIILLQLVVGFKMSIIDELLTNRQTFNRERETE